MPLGWDGVVMNMWRSILFVPATRPERFRKALASAADLVCIDLEDAVAPAQKTAARQAVVEFFAGPDYLPDRVMVRINSPRGPDGAADLAAIANTARAAPLLMIPKAESPQEISGVYEAFGSRHPSLVPLIESAAGLAAVEDISRMTDQGVAALSFGGADFAADIGSTTEWEPLIYARGRIVAAAALGHLPAIDGVWFDLKNDIGLTAETSRVAALGFAGKLAIHPDQIAPIHAALRPSATEIARARRIVDAAATAAGGVCVVDGKMVDQPIIRSARRILDRAAVGDQI